MATIKAARPLCAFLDLCAASEGTSSAPNTRADGYDVIVSGIDGPNRFDDFSHHPFSLGRKPIVVRAGKPSLAEAHELHNAGLPAVSVEPESPLYSTASGRYQIILPTWEELSKVTHLGTFSPANQDIAALQLLRDCHADELILAMEIQAAIEKASDIWASFPGNLYHQGGKPIEWLLAQFKILLQAQSV